MDFRPTEDRRMLADMLGRFLAQNQPWEARLACAYAEPFHQPDVWAGLAEQGILAALVPEEAGGLGGAGFDIATVFEPVGHALSPEPLLGALLGLRVLLAAGVPVEAVIEGGEKLALACDEPEQTDWDSPATRAVPGGAKGWLLTGRKCVVYGGHVADRIIVSAAHDGGTGLFEVAGADVGRHAYAMIDGGGAAEVFLEATPATCLLEDGRAALHDARDHGALALCAEALGVMDWMRDTMADYLRTRKQFGQPIGAFQALQHRFVDLVIEMEQARSITILAADRMGTPGQGRAVAMAKALIGRIGRQMSEEVLQMHGGIGLTWEAPVSHYAKRLAMIDQQLGDTDVHLARVMEAYRTS